MNKRYWMSRIVLVLVLTALGQIYAFAADGDADPTFNPNANDLVYAIAAQSNGMLLVGGNFTNIGGQPRNRLARIDPITGLADSWDPNVTGGAVFKVVVQPNGKILIGGSFDTVLGTSRNGIARFNTDGTLDAAFDPNSTASGFAASVNSIEVLSDTKVLVGGAFSVIGGQLRQRIARLDGTTGAADSFDAGAVNGGVLSIAVQSDGNFVVAGHFTIIGGQSRIHLARLNATTGAADPFDPNPDGQVYAIRLQPDGKILAGGQFSAIGGQTRRGIARIDPATGLVDSWDPNVTSGVVWSIAVQSDGRVFAGGDFTAIGGQSRKFIARLDAATGAVDSFNAGTVSGGKNGIQTVVTQSGGNLLVGGDFTGIGGQSRHGIARLFSTSTPPPPGDNCSMNPHDGCLDPTFGSGGKVLTGFNFSGDDQAYAAAVQADGKIVSVGKSFQGSRPVFTVVRMNEDGSIDTTFSGDGNVAVDFGSYDSKASAVAIQTDGKIVAGGFVNDFGSGHAFAIVRFNTNGSLDTSFGVNGTVRTNFGVGYSEINTLVIQSDGKITAFGLAEFDISGDQEIASARYNTNGTLDSGYGTGGKLLTGLSLLNSHQNLAKSAVLQSNGKIAVIGTYFEFGMPGTATVLIRYNPDGTLDSTLDSDGFIFYDFNPNGYDRPNAIALQTDDKIVIAGENNFVGSGTGGDFYFARFNTNGSLDTSFDTDGIVRVAVGGTNRAMAVTVQPNGKIAAAGEAQIVGSNVDAVAVRLNSDGSLDTTFDSDGIASIIITDHTENNTYSGAFQADGKIITVGYQNDSSTRYDFNAQRFNTDGSADTTFDSDGQVVVPVGFSSGPRANGVAIQTDGKIVAVGEGNGGSGNDFALVRYNTDGTLDTTFDGDGRVLTDFSNSADDANAIVIQPDGKIVIAGRSQGNLDYDFAAVRYNSDGSLDTTFGIGGKVRESVLPDGDIAYAVALQTNGMIVLAGLTLNCGDGCRPDFALMRLDSNGSLDTSFGNGGIVISSVAPMNTEWANSVAIQSNGKIVAAGIWRNGSDDDFALFRYNTDGTLDTTFDTDGKVTTGFGGDQAANAVVIQPDGKIIAGGYSSGNGSEDFALVRYNADGSLDTTFDSDGIVTTPVSESSDKVNSLVIRADGKIVAAGNAGDGKEQDFAIAQYDSAGTLDSMFGTNGVTIVDFGVDERAFGVALQSDGKVVVAGDGGAFALARLLSGISTPTPTPTATPTNTPTATPTATPTSSPTPSPLRSRADFDGDGKTDLSVFRPSEGNWYLNRSRDGLVHEKFGLSSDVPVPGDFDNDGKTDIVVFRANGDNLTPDYFILNSSTSTISYQVWGNPGDIPVTGDYDGDGKSDFALYRPTDNIWYVLRSTGGFVNSTFGISGDIAVGMDFDGDGKTNLTIFRPSNGTWYIARSSGVPAQNFDTVIFGQAGDIPVPADYDGDGKDDIAVFRPSNGTWWINRSSLGLTVRQFGLNGDKPVPGDYDGDGIDDVAVYRNGTWFIDRSTQGLFQQVFGLASDIPIPNKYVP
ncbi:hypothetical protein BH10ACI3_BH10ACI3_20970 [soil metagenome]